MNVPMKVAAQAAVRVGVSAQPGVPLSIGMGYQVGGRPYQGAYEFTPGDEEQTVQTEGRVLLQDKEGNTEPVSEAWRRLFAYVPQGNLLMRGTIREAVSFGNPALSDDDAAIRTCEGRRHGSFRRHDAGRGKYVQ